MRTYKIVVVPGESGKYEISRSGLVSESGDIHRVESFLKRKGKSEADTAVILKDLTDNGEVELTFADDARQ